MKLILFADDTCLFHSSKYINILQNDLNDSFNSIANWLKASKLTLNIDKSSLIKFGRHRDCNNENTLTIQIEDEKPQQEDFAKYLGVYFDNNLSWKKYIEMKSIKVNKELGK